MKQSVWLIKGILCLLSSIYLTVVVSQITLTTWLQVIFVFVYFLLMSVIILFCYNRFLSKTFHDMNKKKWIIIIIALILSLVTVIANDTSLIPDKIIHQKSYITITATGNKNDLSQGKEVWITGISIDNINIDLSQIPLTNGWQYDKNAINAFPDNHAVTLPLKFQKAKNIKISFLMHGWSGIVNISDHGKLTTYDLYSQEGKTYFYTVTGNVANTPYIIKIVMSISCVLFFFIIYFMCILLFIAKQKHFFILYMFVSIFFYASINITIKHNNILTLIFLVFSLMVGLSVPTALANNNMLKRKKEKIILPFILFITVISFILAKHSVITIKLISCYLLFIIYIVPVLFLLIDMLQPNK